jgi:hypothetical protein
VEYAGETLSTYEVGSDDAGSGGSAGKLREVRNPTFPEYVLGYDRKAGADPTELLQRPSIRFSYNGSSRQPGEVVHLVLGKMPFSLGLSAISRLDQFSSYSPKCVEEEFSEVHIQKAVWPRSYRSLHAVVRAYTPQARGTLSGAPAHD